MARKAVLALYLLAAAVGSVGCTWAETRDDYPPSMFQQGHAGHVHGQPPIPGGY